MSPALIIAIIQALAAFAPEIPELVTAIETTTALLKSGTPPTTDQMAQIDAALDMAHKAVQAA